MLAVTDVVGELELLTWSGDSGSGPIGAQVEDAYRTIDAALREAGAAIVQERVFGHLSAAPVVARARARAAGSDNDAWAVPPTFIEGAPVGRREGLAGIHILAARAESSCLVRDGERVLGRVVEAPGARLIGLADLARFGGNPVARSCAEDTRATLDAAEHVLVREGFSYRDVVRTWFYLRDILSWYGSFNAVRSAAYRGMGLIGPGGDGAIPASTGIGARGVSGWCTLDLIAAQAREGHPFEMVRLRNRRQNEAPEYGSAFARGMSLTLGTHRYLFISGTASIDTSGATIHVGDFEGQTTQTIEALAALLEGAGSSLRDIRQATAFIRNPADADAFARLARRARLDAVPFVTTVADVCREELLVEIDAIAVVPRAGGIEH